jgi:hypothetical protein
MSEEEVKKVRYERLIADGVKGSILAVALYVLWGAYDDQNKVTLKRVESLEYQIRECQESKSNRIEQGIEYIIKKLEK